MDIVEAIDTWIDDQIDDLSDDELERVLVMLDAISLSHFADLDADRVDESDIDALVTLAGGPVDSSEFCEAVLRDALLGEPIDGQLINVTSPVARGSRPVTFGDDAAGIADELISEPIAGGDFFYDDDDDDDDEGDDPDDLDDRDPEEGEAEAPLDHDDETDIAVDDFADRDFLTDIDRAQRTDEVAVVNLGSETLGPSWATDVKPVLLREHDLLGPAFLPEPVDLPPALRSRLRHAIVPFFMIAGLAAFGYGMYQLVNSLDEDPTATETTATTATTSTNASASGTASTGITSTDDADGSEFNAGDASTPERASTAGPGAASADGASTATTGVGAELEPPAPFAIRLVTGDVMIASHETADGPAILTQVYDASVEDFSPARELAWGPGGLIVADTDGNVLIIDPTAERDPRILFEATEDLGEAVEIATLLDQIAVRTDLGNIVLVDNDADADPTDVDLAWDAVAEGALATDISAVDNLVPFVLDTGDARMIVTGPEQSIVTIWIANNQPPVFNVEASASGILLGVGQGAIARYRLGDIEGDRFEPVWDPFSTDEKPAIGYSAVGDRTAIVLGDGAIVLADETGTGPRLWDPAETEIRALIAVGGEQQIVVLLETGSVVRIPVESDLPIESIWDITDETLSAANQIVLERTAG